MALAAPSLTIERVAQQIARFRERHLHALGELFVGALRLCKQARLVGLGVLAVDGTKLRTKRLSAQGDELRADGQEGVRA